MNITKTLTDTGECCNYCEKNLYEEQKTIYDKEGGVSYCNDDCILEHIKKHPREYLEMLIDHDLIEMTEQK